jgi:Pregnancy-associated plasma protein-A
MKKTVLLFLVLCSITIAAYSQAICSFDEKTQQLIESSPENAAIYLQTRQQIRDYVKAHPVTAGKSSLIAYSIPVVVHVMHTGGAVGTIYNPSDANIIGAINYLNQVYGGTYPGMEQPVEGGGVVNMELQFVLAQRTPSCGTTNGIDRVDASSIPNYTASGVGTGGCTDLELKNFARWNTANYYNIWVVNRIDGADGTSGTFTAGYAYYPGAPATLDGTVMLATQMLSGEKTLPHEIGHAFDLAHPFEGSTSNAVCPTNANCNIEGDEICDTDPISLNSTAGVFSFVCRTGSNACAGNIPFTRNTESNFMGYTNCYTLFTNGQKARTQAAMSLPSRASLATSLGGTPCGTVINFATGADTKTEDNTGTLSGCRMYRDYTYQMSIGAAPSATATATLTYSGTAVKGLDYEVTTNGNFTSTSNVLTFNTGSTSPQNFTVRVYDDANVEAAETAIINFTLNNGGGNAAIGTTSPTLTLSLNDNDVAPVATGSNMFTIGALTNGVTDAPFNAAIPSQRSQYIYKASELAAAGLTAGSINALQIFVNTKSSSGSFNNFTIKMAPTAVNYLVDGSVTVIGGMTTLHTVASLSTIAGWNNFALTTPFAWDGTSNLAIELCYNSTTSGAGADQIGCYSDGGTATQGSMMFQNSINCSGAFTTVSYYGTGIKPRLQLGLSVSGTPVETVAASTKAEHIVTGSNDYFYSNNNRLMARLSGIDAALGCVQTTVENAGTSWVTFLAGQRSAKVYAITPTTNITTTNYAVSLYFSNAELDGKTASNLRIAKTTAATIAGANAGNTISVVPTVTTLGSNTVFTANFTGFSRFFLIDAAAVLPVTTLTFSAYESNGVGILEWSTDQEINNKGFEVEKSFDGTTFNKLTFIAGKGNANTKTNYSLQDKNLTDIQYYRLKQIDKDGKYSYSNVVLVKGKLGQQRILFVTNPFNTELKITMANKVSKNMVIELLDAAGKTIIKRNTAANGANLFTLLLPGTVAKGIYFINIIADDVRYGTRVIKE